MALQLAYFQNEQGCEPVREWLQELDKNIRLEFGSTLQMIQNNWPASNKKPWVDSLGNGLSEVRIKVDRNQYRILFCILDSTMILLHGFMKKPQKTPKTDLTLARKRHQSMLRIKKENKS